jgi:hypothetical protein
MTEALEAVVARIDERTQSIKEYVSEIKKNQSELYSKHNAMRSDVDKLITEHNDRVNQGAVCSPVIVNTAPVKLGQLLDAKAIGWLAVGAVLGLGAVVAVVLFIAWKTMPSLLKGS